jgi:hypothetical protein
MSDTMVDNEVAKAKINALYAAYEALERDSKPKPSDYQTRFPWRTYDEDTVIDRVSAVKQAMNEIADEIISLEHSLRDPIQDAEMRAEINASIAINGNWDDCADDYMHTPLQERLYQESIYRQMQYDYYDYEGMDWDPFGPCQYCGTYGDYTEATYVAGYSTCYNGCYEEAAAFMYLLSMITGIPVDVRYGTELYFEESEIV